MSDPRQSLPPVNQVLSDAQRQGIAADAPRQLLVDTVREMLDDARSHGGEEPARGWLAELERRVEAARRPSLGRVINATGVILHTNLGRAPLASVAVEAMTEVARYSTLEYDPDAGKRGSRQLHVRGLLRDLTGAEDGMVVNNAAAAMVMVLNAVAAGGETLVSRGELVEIGGAFRIPDILGRSGSILIEVGTTNRTRLSDYEAAVSPRTRCALKVHRSNFSIAGFTAEATLTDLVGLLRDRRIPVVHDLGSGLLLDLEDYGLRGEPLVRESVASGAVVVFSGDKLLGGPQAGIVVGPSSIMARIAENPLARAMRPDKMVIAGLEATLALYRDPDTAIRVIPTLAMLTVGSETLQSRAAALAEMIGEADTTPGTSSVGGGSFPDARLDTTLVSVPADHPDAFLATMRRADPPVIGRAAESGILLDPRTLLDDELGVVANAVHMARAAEG